MKRRDFIHRAGFAAAGIGLAVTTACAQNESTTNSGEAGVTVKGPFAISTWNPEKANSSAWEVLKEGGYALDAIESGIKIEEADANDQSVGYGGRPDREGNKRYYASYQCSP